MRNKVKINLNSFVWFKPTEKGKEAYRRRYYHLEQILKEVQLSDATPFPVSEIKLDENGYAKMQLWEFMQIFGEYMVMGFDNVIESLEIIADEYEIVKDPHATKADQLCSMTDEELAGFFAGRNSNCPTGKSCSGMSSIKKCTICWLNYLTEPMEQKTPQEDRGDKG